MAAGAGMQLALDPVAVEGGARLQGGRQRQAGTQVPRLGRVRLGQGIDAHHLHREVVVAAALERVPDEHAGGTVQVAAMRPHGFDERPRLDVFVHAVAGHHEQVARLDGHGAVVEFQSGPEAERPAQVAAAAAHPYPVVFGQLLQVSAAQQVDAHVAGVEQVRRPALEHQRAQRAHVAPVMVVAPGTALRLGVQPRIGGRQHALHRPLHAPRIRRAVVVLHHRPHGRLARDAADLAAADAVGQGQHDPLAAQVRPRRDARAMEILVHALAAAVGMLSHAHGQRRGQRGAAGRRCGPGQHGSGMRGGGCRARAQAGTRRGAVRTCVEYNASPTKVSPPTRLPTTVGISFQIR